MCENYRKDSDWYEERLKSKDYWNSSVLKLMIKIYVHHLSYSLSFPIAGVWKGRDNQTAAALYLSIQTNKRTNICTLYSLYWSLGLSIPQVTLFFPLPHVFQQPILCDSTFIPTTDNIDVVVTVAVVVDVAAVVFSTLCNLWFYCCLLCSSYNTNKMYRIRVPAK